MAPKEKVPKSPEAGNTGPGGGGAPKNEVPTVTFLQEFLSQLTVNKLMKEMGGDKATMKNLLAIEEDLATGDSRAKLGAMDRLNELVGIKNKVEIQTDKMNAKTLVARVNLPWTRKEKIEDLAKTIDQTFESINTDPRIATPDVLNNLQLELSTLAAGLQVEVNPEAMESMTSKMRYLEEMVKARSVAESGIKQASSLNLFKDEFEAGDKGAVLKVRDQTPDNAKKIQAKLEKYKDTVKKELLTSDKRALEALTPDELLARMEEATYWKANKQFLYGKTWRGSKEMAKLRDVLITVEAEYTAAFEKKVSEKLEKKGIGGEFVRLATQKVIKSKKGLGRSRYDFHKNLPNGKTAYDVIEVEILDNGKKMEKAAVKKSKVVMTGREGVSSGTVEGHASFNSVEEAEGELNQAMELQNRIGKIKNKLKIEFDEEMFERAQSPNGIEDLLEEASIKGLTKSELNDYERFLNAWVGNEGSGRFTGVQAELFKLSKEASRTGNYSKYMIKLQAYIDRVGLRETSSDFQFAIVMRQAKDEISAINDDAGSKFDLWQEAQFLPSITTLDEKTFYSLIPRVVNQARMQYELEGGYANWLAMQVDGVGPDGKKGKRALSVSAFYQMLQSKEVANRVIAAPINGNDSTITALWAEHVWGDGAKLSEDMSFVTLANGQKIENIGVSYFEMTKNSNLSKEKPENMTVKDFMKQSMWMAHYAEKLWWYSGEWEAFAKDFPGERLPQGNKRLLAIGAAFRDYGLEYGKFDVGYAELAKAGVLLQDFRTYKANDVIVANMRHALFDAKNPDGSPIANAKDGDAYGRAMFKALSSNADISEKYHPLSSLRSADDVRLMGRLNEFTSPEARWNYYKKQQEKMGRKGVPSYSKIASLRGQKFEDLRGDDEGWYVQSEQVDIMFDNLSKARADLGKLNWSPAVLHQLMDKQSFIETGSHRERGGESLDEYLKNFQYTSVLSYSELRKGTDPLDYQKYSEAKTEAAKLMTEVLNGTPTLEKLNELFFTMKNYMPPDQIVAWFEEFRVTQIRLRTFQTVKYDIAMTDLEEWKLKKKRGEVEGEHPPASVIGYTPATFSLKDERGDKWNVTGADGFRVTRKKKTWGNHMKSTRNIPGLTAAEIETQNKLYVGNRWLMKETAEEILENSFGLSQQINRFYKDRGWNPNSKAAKFMKKWGTKAVLLLRQHPLFDDPVWAFWNILNELKEYGAEVQKDMLKEVASH